MNISRSCSVWKDSFHFDFPDTDKTISLRTSNKQKCVNVVFLLPSFMSPAVEFVSTVSTVKKQKTKCMDKHDVCFEIKFKSSLDKHDVCFEIKFKSSLDKHYVCFEIKFKSSLDKHYVCFEIKFISSLDKHDVCFEIKFKSSLDKHDVCFEIKFKSSLDKHYFCFGIKFELSLNASKCFYSFWFLKHFWNFNYLFIFFAEKY